MKQNRVHYLSLASVVAAFAMVMLHTNGCFWGFARERYWDTANIIESVMYFAVPVFYMISGATLLDYRERYSTKEYFKKRIYKTLVPYIVWSILGFFLTGDEVKIYWFFIPLFRIYLLIPLVSLIKEENRQRIFVPLSILLFVIDIFFCNIGLAHGLHRTEIDQMCLYMSYVLVGYLIHKYEMSKRWRGLIYALGLVGLAIHMGATYVLSYELGYVVQTWKGYANIPCILYSVAIFVLLKQIGECIKQERFISVMEFLSKYTFAVYLIHWYLMDFAVEFFAIDTRLIVYRCGAPVVLFVLCIAITWCVRKVPVLRRILP